LYSGFTFQDTKNINVLTWQNWNWNWKS